LSNQQSFPKFRLSSIYQPTEGLLTCVGSKFWVSKYVKVFLLNMLYALY